MHERRIGWSGRHDLPKLLAVNTGEVGNSEILLPAVGEMLQTGDEVGLIFFERQVQYAAIVSPQSVGGVTGLIGFIGDTELPPHPAPREGVPHPPRPTTAPPSAPPIPNLEESVRLMAEMGIPDDALSRQALQMTNGDVQAAVNLVFAQLNVFD